MISGVPPTGPTHDAIVDASGAPPAAQAGTSVAAWAMVAEVAVVADVFGSVVAGAADETADGAPGVAAAVGAAAAAVGTGVGDAVEQEAATTTSAAPSRSVRGVRRRGSVACIA